MDTEFFFLCEEETEFLNISYLFEIKVLESE